MTWTTIEKRKSNCKKIEKKIFNFYYFLIFNIFFNDFSKKLNFFKIKNQALNLKKALY